MLTDAEILDILAQLRVNMAEDVSEVDEYDSEAILLLAGLFVAGVDALLVMRADRAE